MWHTTKESRRARGEEKPLLAARLKLTLANKYEEGENNRECAVKLLVFLEVLSSKLILGFLICFFFFFGFIKVLSKQ